MGVLKVSSFLRSGFANSKYKCNDDLVVSYLNGFLFVPW